MSVQAIEMKKAKVEEVASKLTEANSAVVFEYRGLTVEEVTDLRRQLRAEDVELRVLKNKIVERAVEKAGYDGLKESLTGPNAVAFGNGDAIAPARILSSFAKTHEALVLKAGVVEGKVVAEDELKQLAKLPGREGMYSMLLSVLQAPVSQFARVIKAVADARSEGQAPVETVETVNEEAQEA